MHINVPSVPIVNHTHTEYCWARMRSKPIIWGVSFTGSAGFKYLCLIAVSWQDNYHNFHTFEGTNRPADHRTLFACWKGSARNHSCWLAAEWWSNKMNSSKVWKISVSEPWSMEQFTVRFDWHLFICANAMLEFWKPQQHHPCARWSPPRGSTWDCVTVFILKD